VTEVKEAGPFERIITIAVDGDTLEAAKNRAARRLSGQLKIKGFRPGKAPRRIVESMVGSETLQQEAIEEALPGLVTEALESSELEPAATPRVDEIRDKEGGVDIDVRITLWPEITEVPDYEGRRIELEAPPIGDEQVDEQVDRMRDQFAELDDVDREGFDGDYVLIDLKTSAAGGEEIEAGSANDLMYEIGSGSFLEGLDDALRGKGAGSIEEFTTTLPPTIGEHAGDEVTARILVKQVKAKRLPDVTDEWVEEVSEFESVTEMRESLAEQMQFVRESGLRAQFEQKLVGDLRDELVIDIPDALVEGEMDATLHRFAHRLSAQGISIEQYFQLTGQDQQAFVDDLREQANLNLRTRILLEGIARREELEVSADEIDETIESLAKAAETTVEEYREVLEQGAQEKTLAGDILRRKAIDRLLELAVAVDAEGNEIEFTQPEAPASDADADADGADEADEASADEE